MFWTVVMLVSLGVLLAGGAMYLVGRSQWRALPENVVEQIKGLPERRPNQRIVDLELANGRIVHKVWVAWDRYPAMIGGKTIIGRYRPSSAVRATSHK